MSVETEAGHSQSSELPTSLVTIALRELHEMSGADLVLWLEPTVVAGDLWWSRAHAVGDVDLVGRASALRGLRVVVGDHGGVVAEDDDVKPPMPTPPWLTSLRNDRFRRLDPEVVVRLFGSAGGGGENGSPSATGLCALVDDVMFAAWSAGGAVTGVIVLARRKGLGRLSRNQVERGTGALQSRACRLAATEGFAPEVDEERTLHAITDLDGRIEGFSEAMWDRLGSTGREQLEALAATFHASDRLHDTVICALAAIRLERLAFGAGSRTLVIVRPGRRVVVSAVDRLTLRQREIVGYAAAGSTLAEIARSLELSPHTVKYHLKSSYETLGVASRVELLALLRSPA